MKTEILTYQNCDSNGDLPGTFTREVEFEEGACDGCDLSDRECWVISPGVDECPLVMSNLLSRAPKEN